MFQGVDHSKKVFVLRGIPWGGHDFFRLRMFQLLPGGTGSVTSGAMALTTGAMAMISTPQQDSVLGRNDPIDVLVGAFQHVDAVTGCKNRMCECDSQDLSVGYSRGDILTVG